MKKELIMLGSMVAMSGALSSCCCNKGANAAYRQNQQNVYATAPRVVNYKDGGTVRGTPGYIQPTSAEGTTLTTAAPVRQQPVRRVNPCSQVQPQPQSRVQAGSWYSQMQPRYLMLPPNDCCGYPYPSNCCGGYYTSDCCTPCAPCIQNCGGWSIPVHFDFRLNWKGRHHCRH